MQSKQCKGLACYDDELDEWETSATLATYATSPAGETTTMGPTTTTTLSDDDMKYDVTTEEGLSLSIS